MIKDTTNNLKKILSIFFGIVLILAGSVHFLKPEIYFNFIPDSLPKIPLNYLAGSIEILLGVGALFNRFHSTATLGILLLMILFLPLHIIDVFREFPAIGSHQVAVIRLPVQLVLIAWAWFIHKK